MRLGDADDEHHQSPTFLTSLLLNAKSDEEFFAIGLDQERRESLRRNPFVSGARDKGFRERSLWARSSQILALSLPATA